jgi:hypothetical protein
LEKVQFEFRAQGDLADRHMLQAYDGFEALAGFSLALAICSNYLSHGKIRRKGRFDGRSSVLAHPLREGSLIADFSAFISSVDPKLAMMIGSATASTALTAIVTYVLQLNLGKDHTSDNEAIKGLLKQRSGDLAALASAVEPSIIRGHSIIGNGAKTVTISAAENTLGFFDAGTKEYVKGHIDETTELTNSFTVGGFYPDSGHGRVFDTGIGRNVRFWVPDEVKKKTATTFSWGLDQYTNGFGGKVNLTYTRRVSFDGRAKSYMVVDATKDDL